LEDRNATTNPEGSVFREHHADADAGCCFFEKTENTPPLRKGGEQAMVPGPFSRAASRRATSALYDPK
jgi:hypothetical protein